ncbi:MAG: lysylphosphatidylglycerol synthase domain-containing protein, partial [Acidimicrobiales bacterium]
VGGGRGAPDVAHAAEDLGLALSAIEPYRPQVWGVARFTGVADSQPVDISVYGRDASDAQLLAKLGRFVWYHDSGPTLSFTRLQQVEHEAYLTLAAQHAGVNAPDVLLAATATSEKAVVLITRPPSGQPLAEIDPSGIDDGRIDAVFAQLSLLRDARVAHGSLSPSTLVLTPDGHAGVCDFRTASSSAPTERLDRDLAGAMVTIAQVVGAQRSVDAAIRSFGASTVAGALSQVQPAALDPQVRHAMAGRKSQKQLLADIRDLGAKATGVEAPKLTELHRVSLSGLLMSVGALLGLTLVVREITGIGDVWATLQTAALVWVFAAFVVAQSTNFAQAWAVQGSLASSLPYGPTLGLELANAYTGLIGGTVGTTATIIRYFQKRGLAVSIAVSSGVLVSLAGTVVQIILFVVCYLMTKGDFNWAFQSSSSTSTSNSTHWMILSIGVLVIAAIGAVTIVPSFRHKVVDKVKPQVDEARDNLRDLAKQPGKLLRLFAGTAISQILFALTLGCSLHAYGTSLSFAMLIVINTVAGFLGGVAPVPGGIGVIEAGLIAGFVAAGVPSTTAVAATITARLFTCYLPPLWGYPTLLWMRRHEYL